MSSTPPPDDDTTARCLRCAQGSCEGIAGQSLVSAERARQIQVEGWTLEHDRQRGPRALLSASNCYRQAAPGSPAPPWWPWDVQWWKPKGALRNLVRAGALAQAAFEVEPNGPFAAYAQGQRQQIVAAIDVLLDEVGAVLQG